jgi:hypothetical protein
VPDLKDIYEQRLSKEKAKEWLVLSYIPEEFGVTDPKDIAWMKSRLCPMHFHTHDESLAVQNIKSKKLSKIYITFTNFGKSMFKGMEAEKVGCWDYHEFRRCHDAMITAP